jgi:uncharacterized membrane protein YoaK (UPF0700 family)
VISKLPRWIEIGGFLLAGIAGYVNAVGLLGFAHQSMSHLTGASTLLGLAIANIDGPQALHLVIIILSFVIGAVFSGFYIENTALKIGGRYGFALVAEGVLLFLAMICLNYGLPAGNYFASMACGLQNAMVTTFSGAIVRTTHVTGLLTDIGLMLGAKLRRNKLDTRKLLLLSIIFSGFICGGILGATLFAKFTFNALVVPATAAIILALVYWYFLIYSQGPQAKEH